ncbi:hypothetical protein ABZ128_31450 [Streptomyces sp. NPDC006326]|uniref:hypothetical protein n=1 Tax=Streptomyces sp. NPDC006326 TaxID=3156752 RepID=UPI00339F19D8
MVAGRRIRFTAVLVAVVFALTGFSHGGHGSHGGKSSSGGSGGGCSSSKKRSSYHSTSDNNNTNGSGKSTPSPTKSARPPAHAQVVSCAGPGSPKAVLRVTSDVDTTRTVDVPVVFQGAGGVLDRTSVRVTLKARETQTVTAAMVHEDKAAETTSCTVGIID